MKFKQKVLLRAGIYLTLLSLLSPLIFASGGYASQPKPQQNKKADRRVLFISSYSYSWETVPEQITGVQEALDDEATIDYQFMDTKNRTSESWTTEYYDYLKSYLSEVPPYDALIVGDDAAFQFALTYQDELFSGIPIAFEGVNDIPAAKQACKDPLISGVIEDLSYDNTILLARKLYPDATRIVAILDDSITGKSERKEFYSKQSKFSDLEFGEINASKFTSEQLKQKLGELKSDTILLYVMCSSDASGHNYVGSEGIELVSSSANIPTFSIVSIGMGKGVLGGEIVSQKLMGEIAGDMIQQYFDDVDFATIGMKNDSPRTYMFDENVMRQYGISAASLPEGSEYYNHKPTFVEQNINMIRISAAVGVVLLVLLVVLFTDNVYRRHLNAELERTKASLQDAVRYDALTGLHNRAVFMNDLSQLIKDETPFALVLYDIDHFKTINDTLGHTVGDLVLQETANRTRLLCDENFNVYRLGGDEFTALITTDSKKDIISYITKIQESLLPPVITGEEELHLTISIGAAIYPQDAENETDLLVAADEAMYMIKKNGRNGYYFVQH